MVWAENCSLLCVMPKNIRQYCAHATTHNSTPESVCQAVRQSLCTTAGADRATKFPTAVVRLACYTSIDSCSKEAMSPSGFKQFITYRHGKTKISLLSLASVPGPTVWQWIEVFTETDITGGGSICWWRARNYLKALSRFVVHSCILRWGKEGHPVHNWNQGWMSNDLESASSYVRRQVRNYLVAAPQQAAYLPLLQEESPGDLLRFSSACSLALPTWPKWAHAVARAPRQRCSPAVSGTKQLAICIMTTNTASIIQISKWKRYFSW